MNLEVRGSRPPSARRNQSYNPITGEEMPFSARGNSARGDSAAGRPQSRPFSRPDGVPTLELGKLDGGGDDARPKHLNPYHYKLDTPDTASTVSWGTPSSSARMDIHETSKQEKHQNRYQNERVHIGVVGGVPAAYHTPAASGRYVNQPARDLLASPKPPSSAWDREPVPENLPSPGAKYQSQYQQYQQEMRDSYRNKSARNNVTEAEVAWEVEKLKLKLDVSDLDGDKEEEEEYLKLTKTFNQQPYSKASQQKRDDVETLEMEKKKNKLIETVMIDELSRYPVCDVEQNAVLSQRVPTYIPGMKGGGAVRKLHDTRVRTATSNTENLLSRRVRFGARILTRTGRDAVRELSGFFFAVDNSLTIYEFRQFGKAAKALPFIKRGVYTHQSGRRKGEPYTLQDIIQGGDLVFGTRGQPIPEQMQGAPTLTFRVTDVDDAAKGEIMLESVALGERDEAWKRLHLPPTKAEIQDYLLQKKVQGMILKQIERRGIKTLTGLHKHFRQLDENGDGVLNKYELEKALIDFHIYIPDEVFEDLWEVVDKESSSFLEYDTFLRAFVADMVETRKALVRKAYLKLDPGKKGYVLMDDMRKFYNANKHPKVKSGECSEAEMSALFLSSFEFRADRDKVTYSEWEAYYEGLSVCVAEDEDFANMLRNAWSV